ncbi:hypothetical protein MPOCJGCO_4417 [Methylobacterium trifolii]|uniref:Sensor histidine kinase n=1 Tax=Methylobacterium trifolii TaxID=1003092 RepID=A0ABQ4U5S9_9HYPH|nr:hypothetical protein MPOCJGCO_4417 [Methylobacterium trifolii]
MRRTAPPKLWARLRSIRREPNPTRVGGATGGPPTRVGFGSRLIERSLAHSFGGAVRLTFPPAGVVLALEAELSQVVAG